MPRNIWKLEILLANMQCNRRITVLSKVKVVKSKYRITEEYIRLLLSPASQLSSSENRMFSFVVFSIPLTPNNGGGGGGEFPPWMGSTIPPQSCASRHSAATTVLPYGHARTEAWYGPGFSELCSLSQSLRIDSA